MRQMLKYQIPNDEQWHPIECQPALYVGVQYPYSVMVWAEMNPANPPVTREYRVFGTGVDIPDDAQWVGTTQDFPRGLVWHLYERINA